MIKYIRSFFVSLNANAHPGDIAHGAALGLLLALVPKGNLLWAFLFILTMFIRVNKGALFLTLILFGFVVPLLDPVLESLGFIILGIGPLQGFYGVLYGIPFMGWTRYNNTMVAGSLSAALVLYVPAYLLFRVLVAAYRKHILPAIRKSKIVHVLSNLPLIKQLLAAPEIGGLRK
jgi:uncharacterized protein (TIGR03546 family)